MIGWVVAALLAGIIIGAVAAWRLMPRLLPPPYVSGPCSAHAGPVSIDPAVVERIQNQQPQPAGATVTTPLTPEEIAEIRITDEAKAAMRRDFIGMGYSEAEADAAVEEMVDKAAVLGAEPHW